MVKLAVSAALAALLVGCLSKPDFTGGNLDIDCSKHAGQIPYNLLLSGPPRVGELDGNAGDDLVLFGSVLGENDQPTASGAWLVYGGADMSASCYDQALFLFDSAIEDPKTTSIIDVTLADVNSDGKEDVLLESRDGDNYYAGAALSGPSGIGQEVVTLPASRQIYTSAWGDTSPAFVAACPTTVAFGGNTGPYASAYVAGTGDLTILKPIGADTTSALSFSEPVEYVWRDIGGHDLLVGGTSELHAIRCPNETNDADMYRPYPVETGMPTLDAATFSDMAPRAINPYHRALGGVTLATSTTEETPADRTWNVVSYSPAVGFSVYVLDNIDRVETDGATRVHESLGQTVASGAKYDLIALLEDTSPRIRIFPSLELRNTSTLESAAPIDGRVDRPDAKYVAVGNWSGTATHDSIFVIDRETTTAFGACYEPIAAGCIVPCGQTTCP
ncbi:MAG TPA: hypothetical protein VGM39_14475 [Kofleriaceae bacterium]